MIDICCPIHKNYDYVERQISHWTDHIRGGGWRLIFRDNTPVRFARPIAPSRPEVCSVTVAPGPEGEYDGESHGGALDALVRLAETPIVGIVDSDFFWLDPDILSIVEREFSSGTRCLGVDLVDHHSANVVHTPCAEGMFVDRALAMEQTFVVTRAEGDGRLLETGWRIRRRLVEQGIPYKTFSFCGRPPRGAISQLFGPAEGGRSTGLHLRAGSANIQGRNVDEILSCEVSRWK